MERAVSLGGGGPFSFTIWRSEVGRITPIRQVDEPSLGRRAGPLSRMEINAPATAAEVLELVRRVMQGACRKVFVYAVVLGGLAGCWRPTGIGVGGKYNDALTEMGRTQRGGNVNRVIVDLEYVVRRNPRYKDSLTQLGRAYYYAGRYSAAFDVLKRAVTVNKDDEVAWVVIGLTQLRRGDDERGLASLSGGLTLLAKATRRGYKDIKEEYWDLRGVVRRSLRQSISLARKGVGEKRRILPAGELLLHRIDRAVYDAEEYQARESYRNEGIRGNQ